MKKNKHTYFDDFDSFEDYEEADLPTEDETFQSQVIAQDLSDVNYADFNKTIDDSDVDSEIYYEDEEDDKAEESKKNSQMSLENARLMVLLSNFWFIFRLIGIAIAFVLFVYFIVQGRIQELLSYLILLILSFAFGFCFMFVVNKVMEQ